MNLVVGGFLKTLLSENISLCDAPNQVMVSQDTSRTPACSSSHTFARSSTELENATIYLVKTQLMRENKITLNNNCQQLKMS